MAGSSHDCHVNLAEFFFFGFEALKKEFLIRCQGRRTVLVLVITIPHDGIAGVVKDASSVDFDCREQVKKVRDALGGECWGDEFLNRIHDGIEGWRVVGLGVDDLLYVA